MWSQSPLAVIMLQLALDHLMPPELAVGQLQGIGL